MDRPDAESSARVRSLVERHYDFVWRTLQYLGMSEANAEDGAQQVMCVLARRIHGVEVGAEGSFLFSAAVRVASEWRRAARRRPVASEGIDLDELVADSPGAEEILHQRRAREVLDQVLDAMPTDLRIVFVFYELEELTMSAIAEVLGIPPGTVASRLRRAREAFQGILARMQTASRRHGGPR